jgi:transcription antitermination factor NusG
MKATQQALTAAIGRQMNPQIKSLTPHGAIMQIPSPTDFPALLSGEKPSGWHFAMRWYCFKISPKSDYLALQELSRKGFSPFIPWFVSRRDKGDEVIRNLFPGYGFVALDLATGAWRDVFSTRGVDWLFCSSPELPAALPHGIVEALQARGRPGDGVIDENYRGPEFPALGASQAVRITAGPFADLHGICRWSNQKRIAVLLDLMGKQVEVNLKRGEVEGV